MITLRIGERARISALAEDPARPDGARSSLRPGEVWEGTIEAIALEGDGRQKVTIRVDLLNGMRTSAIKEVYADSVSWDPS